MPTMARTAARLQTPSGDTLTWEMVRPECGRRPIEKARGRFPGAGSQDFCDDEEMPVICPTCQLLFKMLKQDRREIIAASWQLTAGRCLALPPQQPRLQRVVPIEAAQLVVKRRRPRLRRMLRIDAGQRNEPA